MEKYVVLKDMTMNNDIIDTEIVSFHDNEEEANNKAMELFFNNPKENRDIVAFSVGLITDEDLEDHGNWESFTEVEILSVFDDESDD